MSPIKLPYLINTGVTHKYGEFHILYRKSDHIKTLIGLWTSIFTDRYEETIWFKGYANKVTINEFRKWWLRITSIVGITTVGWVIFPERKDRHLTEDISWYVKATSTSTDKPQFTMDDLSIRALYCEINKPYESLTELQQTKLYEAIEEEACNIGFIHPNNFEQRSYSPTGELFTSWTHHVKGHRFILKETLTRDV
jgi:hypothetical protein